MNDPDDPAALFGAMIRQARKRAGLSQVKLAKRIGITQSYISTLERGHQNPPLLTCILLATGVNAEFKFEIVFT